MASAANPFRLERVNGLSVPVMSLSTASVAAAYEKDTCTG